MFNRRTQHDDTDPKPGIDWIVVSANALGLALVILAATYPPSHALVEVAGLDVQIK